MKIDRKGLKAQAKQAIRAAAPVFWLVTLVYLLLTEGLSTVVGWLAPTFQPADLLWGGTVGWLSLFISILLTLYLWVMDFGYRLWALRVTRSQQAGYGTLLEGFGISGRVIAMNLLILLFTFLWSLLLIFVTTILAFFVLDSLFLQLLVMAGIYAAVFAIMLRYAMAPYLLADRPDDGAGLAIRRSMELMRGWKWELFKLDFSFLGWLILLEALRLLAACAALAGSGFFALLTQLPAADLPGLIPGYLVWLNDFSGTLATFSDTQVQLFTLFSQVGQGTFASLLGDLFSLPLLLWLTPYRRVAHAAFYDARQAMPEAAAQDLPPL